MKTMRRTWSQRKGSAVRSLPGSASMLSATCSAENGIMGMCVVIYNTQSHTHIPYPSSTYLLCDAVSQHGGASIGDVDNRSGLHVPRHAALASEKTKTIKMNIIDLLEIFYE